MNIVFVGIFGILVTVSLINISLSSFQLTVVCLYY